MLARDKFTEIGTTGSLFSILSLSSPSVFACINTYAFELGRGLSKEEIKAKLAENLKKPYKTVAQQNDYAVILIYDGQYKKAIQLLTQLEKQHPNLAKTAAKENFRESTARRF